MIERQAVRDALKSMIRKSTEREYGVNEIQDNSHFVADLGFDSISAMTLAIFIQEGFGINVGNFINEYNKCETLTNLIEFVISKREFVKISV